VWTENRRSKANRQCEQDDYFGFLPNHFATLHHEIVLCRALKTFNDPMAPGVGL